MTLTLTALQRQRLQQCRNVERVFVAVVDARNLFNSDRSRGSRKID